MAQHKQEWGSRLGVILAVSGSAVGLGNFLRFPGNAAQNGGGAFMIPYFLAFLLLGIPIGWAEWTQGRYGGRKGFHSAPAILGVWGKGAVARYLGSFGVMIPFVVYFYYVMIEAWCLCYAWNYATGGIGIQAGQAVAEQVSASQGFFAEITGSNFDGFLKAHAGRAERLPRVDARRSHGRQPRRRGAEADGRGQYRWRGGRRVRRKAWWDLDLPRLRFLRLAEERGIGRTDFAALRTRVVAV